MSPSARIAATLGAAGLGFLVFACGPSSQESPPPSGLDVARPAAVTTVPTSNAPLIDDRVRPGDEPPEVQRRRVEDATAILARLGQAAVDSEPEERPGAGTFRKAELEKLGELLSGACRGADPPCREILVSIAAAELPFDEVRELYGLFLGPLKARAHVAAVSLGTELLSRPDGKTRDIAFRIAVGSGAARRGQEDADGRRATTIPLRPRVGEPVWVVFEWMAACNDVEVDVKGPDVNGRLDLAPRDPCEPIEAPPGALVPPAIRAVWAHRVDRLGEEGLAVWMPDAERPLVAVQPRPEAEAPKDPSGP